MNEQRTSTRIVSCGIFRRELARLGQAIPKAAQLIFFDSMMHMHPTKLDDRLRDVAKARPEGQLLLLYGDCCPHIHDLCLAPGIEKVEGVNCCEIMLGRERYKVLRREGVFVFLPEWVLRWEEVFKLQLGFSDPLLARSFMREMHKRLVYADTGSMDIPHRVLADIADHFGMPVEIEPIGLEHLEHAVTQGLRRLAAHA